LTGKDLISKAFWEECLKFISEFGFSCDNI